MSGTDASSRFRNRPSESPDSTGSTCERPGQVADDRADARAAAAAGRQQHPRRVGAAHLERHLAGDLEHLVVQQEEARQPVVADQRELLVEPARAPRPACASRARTARRTACRQSRGELLVGLGHGGGRPVAEVARQVERDAGRRSRTWRRPPPAGRRTAPPSRRAASARARGCRAARPRRRRAWRARGSPRARPAAAPRRRLWTCTSLSPPPAARAGAASARRARSRDAVAALERRAAARRTSRPSNASAQLPHLPPRPRSPWRAQPVRQTARRPARARRRAAATRLRRASGRDASRVPAWARVISSQRCS